MRRDSTSYRADIDGWRAVAVVAVVANHFDKAWLPGGYLGVDVFFVISGFVITLSLLGRKADGLGAFLADFYSRRMRRLLPALAICVVMTSFVIWLVDPASRTSLSTGLAALFGVSNITLANQDADYFAPSTELNAFTHTWSLGVEEQFYLLYPLLLWFLYLGARAQTPRRFVIALSALLAISFVVFVATAQRFPVFNYYQLPARFWELAAGALTFLVTRERDVSRLTWAPWIAALGLAVSLVLPNDQRVFATTLAVLATATLLATTPASPALTWAMTRAPMRFLGGVSYPLYLWHWGVLAVSRFTIGVSLATAPFQFALMIALAWFTWRFIETPVRSRVIFRARSRVLLAGLGVILLCASLPATLRLNKSLGPIKSAASDMIPEGHLPLVGSGKEFDSVCVDDGIKWKRRPDLIEQCTAPPLTTGGNTIWAFGDSHAGQLQPLLYAVRDATGMGAHVITVPDTAFPSVEDSIPAREGRFIFDSVSPRFKAGDIVVLARLYLAREGAQRPKSDVPEWPRLAAQLADELAPRGVRVVVVGPLPMFRFASALSCVRSLFTSDCVVSRDSLMPVVDDVTNRLKAAQQGHPNLSLFLPFDILCPPANATCTPFYDNRLAYRDNHHLTVVGSSALVRPFMEMVGLQPARANALP